MFWLCLLTYFWTLVLKDSILRLYSQGNSYTQISRQMALSKQLVMKTIRQYVEENKIVTKGPSYMSQRNAQANIAAANAAAAAAQQRRFSTDDAFDGERGMMFQENAGDDEEDEYGEGMSVNSLPFYMFWSACILFF